MPESHDDQADQADQEQESNADPILNQKGELYSTRGRTLIRSPFGRRFRGTDQELPEVTSAGVNMTRDQAEQVMREAESMGITLTLGDATD